MRRCGGIFDIAAKKRRLDELELILSGPDILRDPEYVGKITQEALYLRRVIKDFTHLKSNIVEINELLEIASSEGVVLFEEESTAAYRQLERLYCEPFFQNPQADASAIVTVKPGASDTESQYWANMILCMYMRFAERHGFSVEILNIRPTSVKGILSAELIVRGERAYGMLKPEHGVHRLISASPHAHDEQSYQQISCCSLEVIPEVEDTTEIPIDPSDILVDVFRTAGHGGQFVNTTLTGVRITYKPNTPEMIIVISSARHSQIKNRELAMRVLRSRLYKLEEYNQCGQQSLIEWGTPIRSYVLDKQYVKDHRTGEMRHDPSAVLDGDIGNFIYAGLKWMAGQRTTVCEHEQDPNVE